MAIEPLMVIGALGGGILGAAIGALPAITLWGAVLMITGLAGLIGNNPDLIWNIGFNPLFGAHMVYAGGAAAAVYAWKKGVLESGLDILKPLSGFGRPDVLLVGGVFGVIGMLLERIGTGIGIPTDNVALSVVITGWLARLLFDGQWRANRKKDPVAEGESCWPNTKELGFLVVLGGGVGLASAVAAVKMGDIFIPFGLALLFLIYLQMGFNGAAWHHIVIVAGLAALRGNGSINAIVWAVVLGIIVAILASCINKLWISQTNSYIDPPVTTIAIGSSIIIALSSTGLL
ncbi:hypothetical protein [Desulforamulus aquiferis]|uniref:DUF7973 domain-containing protein n=1 Tax=Desulforamulus aquiferis TaxID=1397668 RepID=A0AAW7ZG10_9FIRM|nr:hypothetical protein [Desulforamulus aquiferis]MDO7788188.1 hypothetical protein [Desulforamulus aquiferis]